MQSTHSNVIAISDLATGNGNDAAPFSQQSVVLTKRAYIELTWKANYWQAQHARSVAREAALTAQVASREATIRDLTQRLYGTKSEKSAGPDDSTITAVLNGLLSRGYQVVAKISNHGRVQKLRQHLGPWPPTSSPGRAMAAVLRPHRLCRTTRQWVMRTPKDKDGYQYAVFVTSLSEREPPTVADAYDGRAMIEATFCQDKQALGLVKRRQHKWEAQQVVLL